MADNLTAAKRAVRALLEPVVRILLRSGIPFAQFSALAKQAYVAVATRDFGLRGRPTNISRVALLTGLTRRDVRKQRQLIDEQQPEAGGRVSNIARVLYYWHSDQAYVGEDGTPKPLPAEGAEPSFESLYRNYGGGDVPATAALKELLNSGTVVRDEGGLLVARRRYFMPAESDPVAIERAGEVLSDIGETVTYNLFRDAGELSRFEGRATSRYIPEEALDAYRELIEVEGQRFLELVDEWLSDHEDDSSGERHRVGIGIYQILAPPPTED